MVKSPELSPDIKKSKIEVFPERKPLKIKEIDKSEVLAYTTALSGFETPTEEQLVFVDGDEFRHHPNEDIEKYFHASAEWGVPAIAWNIVRPVFLWKVEFAITEFMNVEKKKKKKEKELTPMSTSQDDKSEQIEKAPETPTKEKTSITGSTKINLIKTVPVLFSTEESIEFILNKAKSFEGFPFTWQRLCELIIAPMQHYNQLDKFLRAMDRVINVVTTITQWGGRVTGDWELPTPTNTHMESMFFGPVDEIDAMDQQAAKEKAQEEEEMPLDMSKKTEESSGIGEMKPPGIPSPRQEREKEKEEKKKKEEEAEADEQEKMDE